MKNLLSKGDYVDIIAGGMHVKCKVTDIAGSCYSGFIIQLKQELFNGELRECNPLENVVLPQANVIKSGCDCTDTERITDAIKINGGVRGISSNNLKLNNMKKGIGEIRGFEERIEKTRNNSAYKKQEEYFYPDEKLPERDVDDDSYSIEVKVVVEGDIFEGYYEFNRNNWYVHFGGDTFGHRRMDYDEIEKWKYKI